MPGRENRDRKAHGHGRVMDFLNEVEMHRLLEAAKDSRNGVRDHLMILMIWRHGLRVSELIGFRRDALNLAQARVWVSRRGNSVSAEHPIRRDELQAIKSYLQTRSDNLPWMFVSERQAPFTDRGVEKIVANAGKRADLGHVYPHMLRHSCGYYMAKKGCDSRTIQEYLGHRTSQHTARYMRAHSAPRRAQNRRALRSSARRRSRLTWDLNRRSTKSETR